VHSCEELTYVEGEVAVAVACDVIVADPFLASEIAAAAGEEDKCRYEAGHCACWRARRARFLAGFDRSILNYTERRETEERDIRNWRGRCLQ